MAEDGNICWFTNIDIQKRNADWKFREENKWKSDARWQAGKGFLLYKWSNVCPLFI